MSTYELKISVTPRVPEHKVQFYYLFWHLNGICATCGLLLSAVLNAELMPTLATKPSQTASQIHREPNTDSREWVFDLEGSFCYKLVKGKKIDHEGCFQGGGCRAAPQKVCWCELQETASGPYGLSTPKVFGQKSLCAQFYSRCGGSPPLLINPPFMLIGVLASFRGTNPLVSFFLFSSD